MCGFHKHLKKKFRTRFPNQKMPGSYLLAGRSVFEKQEMGGQEGKALPPLTKRLRLSTALCGRELGPETGAAHAAHVSLQAEVSGGC